MPSREFPAHATSHTDHIANTDRGQWTWLQFRGGLWLILSKGLLSSKDLILLGNLLIVRRLDAVGLGLLEVDAFEMDLFWVNALQVIDFQVTDLWLNALEIKCIQEFNNTTNSDPEV
jgi:hypothetical protein